MELWQQVCLVAYCCVVAVLGLYGFHRYLLLRLFHRHRRDTAAPHSRFTALPPVTIQLPLYNEFHVVERLLDAVAQIDYPRDLLQVQVLDDSTDATRQKAQQCCQRLQRSGLDIHYLHRAERTGFKAGALAAGLASATGQFVLILDADFVPPADLLHGTIHHFTDPQIGMVQTRWGHLNREHSLLTRIQSIFLDGHFVIEHTARSRSGRFFNFNGTGGIWRKAAIVEAGGWQHDTLTEDLDLSYRAQLAGWRFLFLSDVEVPGEIPVEINGFKSQQHRWTKGAVQVAKKLLFRIWRSDAAIKAKVEATFHLTANICYILMLLMALLTLPVLNIRTHLGWERLLIIDLPLFSFATMAISGFYLASQRALYPDWKRQIKLLPMLMAMGMSLCINNTRAVIEGWIGYETPFLRTPKYGVTNATHAPHKPLYSSRRTVLALGELGMAAYFAYALYQAWHTELYMGLPFLLLFLTGFLYTGLLSSTQEWLSRMRSEPQPI